MTKAERELLVGIANILRDEFVKVDSHLQWEIGGLLDSLVDEDQLHEALEEELANIDMNGQDD